MRFVDLPRQVRLAYVEQGDPAGLAVLLLHGYTDSLRSFERVLPHLPRSLRVIALSQRGHGDSSHPIDGYRPQDFAADLAEFMDAMRIDRAVIVGHSMGAAVGQRFAIDHPGRTLGLVLAGAFFSLYGHPGVTEFSDSVVSTLRDPVDRQVVCEFQQSTLSRPVPAEFFETVVDESLKLPAFVWRAAMYGMLDSDFAAALGRIAAPTLILWGDRDSLAGRADQDALLRAIPRSRLLTYGGTGHAVHWEEPERFSADLVKFVWPLSCGRTEPRRVAR